ncbi:hypothetical protein BC831DRAFT_554130, partial [Entophlyctis helioformis]
MSDEKADQGMSRGSDGAAQLDDGAQSAEASAISHADTPGTADSDHPVASAGGLGADSAPDASAKQDSGDGGPAGGVDAADSSLSAAPAASDENAGGADAGHAGNPVSGDGSDQAATSPEDQDVAVLESTMGQIRADIQQHEREDAAVDNETVMVIGALDALAIADGAGADASSASQATGPEGSSEAASAAAASGLAADPNASPGFGNILFSNDRVHPVPPSTRTITSPIPTDLGVGFQFVNVDYEADPDALYLDLTTIMSRSASVEEFLLDEASMSTARLAKALQLQLPPRQEAPDQDGEFMDGESHDDEGDGAKQENDQAQAHEPPPEVEVDREAIIASIKQNLELKDKLGQRNVILQNKLGEYFKKKRSDDTRDGEKSVSDQEQRYANCMSSLNELRAEYNSINVTNQKVVSEYKSKLEERVEEVTAKADEFWKYKRTLESTERKKENEVVAVRLENIKLRNKLRRHEQLLRQKEELADGLHLIDFEQLKIENQTYNEKIEERNEELLKLRKKITNVVQVLTHVKEKLQFVQGETVELKQELKKLDEEVTARRDSLPMAKQERDMLRSTNTLLRQKNGLLGNNNLLRDYGEKVDESKDLRTRIEDLQRYYTELINETHRLRRKMQKAQLVAQMNMTMNTTMNMDTVKA